MLPTDLRTALRSLRATPMLTVVAFLLLAIGIGASTVVFSVVDTVVLRTLPFDRPDELVAIETPGLREPTLGAPVAPQDFLGWRERQTNLSAIAAVSFMQRFVPKDGGDATPIRARASSAGLFDVLHVAPILGRVFTSDNEVAGRDKVAVVGYDLWQRRFGGDPSVVGRTITFNQGTFELLGVMPAGFTYPIGLPEPAEMWVPWVPQPKERQFDSPGRSSYLQVVGRLKDGRSIDDGRAEIAQIHASLRAEYSQFPKDVGVVTKSLRDALLGAVRPWMVMLLTAVGVLLLVACVNVANLLLARSMVRQRDFAVRAALGASRPRLVREALLESAVLSFAATLAGVLFAVWGVAVARANLPNGIPRATAIAIDFRVVLVAAMAGAVTAILIGLLPALRSTRGDVVALLGGSGRTHTSQGTGWRAALIIGEVALVTTILVGAGLVVLSFARLVNVDLGISYEQVTAYLVQFDRGQVPTTSQHPPPLNPAHLRDLLARVGRVPGVENAALVVDGLPLSGGASRYSLTVPGRGDFNGVDMADLHEVSPSYFDTMRIRLLRGRGFDDHDVDGAAPVIVLNDAAARRYFGSADPVGATVQFWGDRAVVGVVAGVRLHGPETSVLPEIYVPLAQASVSTSAELVVRTSPRSGNLQTPIRAAIDAMAPGQATRAGQSLAELFRGLTARRRFTTSVMTIFGVSALGLAVLGLYGVMSSIVAQQAREMGLRIALGATIAGIERGVIRRALSYVMTGAALGLAAAWLIERVLADLLFRVSTHEPIVYSTVTVVLLVVGVGAAYLPARRASRVDPVVALRAE